MDFASRYHLGARWRLRICLELLHFGKNDRVLDAGCGDGFISWRVCPYVDRVVGIDISDETIRMNQRFANDRLSFMTQDLNELHGIFHQTFDKIICLDVLEHAFGFENIIKNFGSALKTSGELLVTIPIKDHGHFQYSDNPLSVSDVLLKYGFRIELLETISQPFLTRMGNRGIEILQKFLGLCRQKVDSYEKTLAFALRNKETSAFWLYKLLFGVLFALTALDRKDYVPGDTYLLIKAHKELD